MRTIGNILWFIFGGLLGGLAWIFAGCIWCITIIGIPFGKQFFKMARLSFMPFGAALLMKNEIILFTDGNINIEVQINPEQETVWLTQKYCLMLSILSH